MSSGSEHASEQEVQTLRMQREVLATFGGHALRTDDLDGLLHEAMVLISRALDVKLVKVLELLPDGDSLLVRAGVNWKPGVVGHATFGAHARSPGGYALQTCEPVISNDVATEDRFEIPALLQEHGVKSMINVVIRGEGDAWGVLEVDSPAQRQFTRDDADFLQSHANLLAFAIERCSRQSELEDAAQTRQMLLGELQHRIRNMITTVRALAKLTRRYSSDLDGFASAFDTRLDALARTQNLLTRDQPALVGVREIVLQELEAHGVQPGDRLVLQGPDWPLSRDAIQALAVGLHELATNAIKYGALATDTGEINVSWSIEPPDEMLLSWRERGVEIGGEPSRRGFGSRVIEEVVPHMLGGAETSLDFHADGIECTIRFAIAAEPPSAPSADGEA
ncbi:MAG TPA: HWE histidine kinase domain-containing protein [Rhodanobacteraceae bacterium]|nr:HWE histidine kinase domain-containing protein [Rhodanobacteraceae bacterium]